LGLDGIIHYGGWVIPSLQGGFIEAEVDIVGLNSPTKSTTQCAMGYGRGHLEATPTLYPIEPVLITCLPTDEALVEPSTLLDG